MYPSKIKNLGKITLGGPIIIPVQCVRVMSSSFSKPQLIVPSPTPFWPCSNSSNKRKFRGTTTNIKSKLFFAKLQIKMLLIKTSKISTGYDPVILDMV